MTDQQFHLLTNISKGSRLLITQEVRDAISAILLKSYMQEMTKFSLLTQINELQEQKEGVSHDI